MAGVGVAAYLEVRHIGPSLDGMMANSGRQQSLLQYSEYEGNKKLCQDPQLSLEGHASLGYGLRSTSSTTTVCGQCLAEQ